METAALREKSVEELRALGEEERRNLFDLRFKHYTGQLINTATLKNARRQIARIETIIHERETAQMAAE